MSEAKERWPHLGDRDDGVEVQPVGTAEGAAPPGVRVLVVEDGKGRAITVKPAEAREIGRRLIDAAMFADGLDDARPEPYRTDVRSCARCGGNHRGLAFRPFPKGTRPPIGYHAWARCPKTKAPILAAIMAAR